MHLPERIVCLTEETTELLYLLGEEERIVGISAYTVRPARAREEKPVVSAFISGSLQKIAALEPDLIVGFSDIQGDLARDLIKAGHNVLVQNQRSIAEIFQCMQMLGNLVGRGPETETLIQGWQDSLDAARQRAQQHFEDAGRRRPRVFFQEWDEPLITGIHWVSELIEIAGGEDCFPELRQAAMARDRIVTTEAVAERRPDLIIGSWCGKPVDYEWVRSQTAWQNTVALRNEQLYELDSAIILQPGPALFSDGLQALQRCVEDAQTSDG